MSRIEGKYSRWLVTPACFLSLAAPSSFKRDRSGRCGWMCVCVCVIRHRLIVQPPTSLEKETCDPSCRCARGSNACLGGPRVCRNGF